MGPVLTLLYKTYNAFADVFTSWLPNWWKQMQILEDDYTNLRKR